MGFIFRGVELNNVLECRILGFGFEVKRFGSRVEVSYNRDEKSNGQENRK